MALKSDEVKIIIVFLVILFPFLASDAFGLDKNYAASKGVMALMQGLSPKYYLSETECGDFGDNRQA